MDKLEDSTLASQQEIHEASLNPRDLPVDPAQQTEEEQQEVKENKEEEGGKKEKDEEEKGDEDERENAKIDKEEIEDQDDDAPLASTSNIAAEDVDETTLQKLRGDAIGDTVFSEKAVLKTILRLQDMQWSEDLEDDLCLLWDTTVDDDVCQFLCNLNFPTLANELLVEHCENNRFVEILVGMLANMLCSKCEFGENVFTNTQVRSIVSLLHHTDDALILVQVLRYASAVMHNKGVNIGAILTQADVEKLSFFLNNSLNVDVLVNSVKIMSTFCISHAENEANANQSVIDGSVFASALVAQKTVAEATEYWSEQHRQAMVCAFEILNCLSGQFATTEGFRYEIGEYLESFLREFGIFLKYFSSEYNADPSEQFLYCLNTGCDVCYQLRISGDRDVVRPLGKLLQIRASSDSYGDVDFAHAVRLFSYFLMGGGRSGEYCEGISLTGIFDWVKEEVRARKFGLVFENGGEPPGLSEC